MADKVFRKNNFYERPWTSLLRRGFLENLRGECSWIRVPYSCYVFRDSGNIFRVHCSPPSPSNSNCFIVIIAIPFNVKQCVWENIYLGTRNDVENVFYRVWSDFQLCIGNLWFLFAVDYLIPIPWRTVLYQKWFFLSKKDSFILQQILKSKYCEIEISKIHFMK